MFPTFRASVLGPGLVIGTNAVVHMVLAQGVAVGLVGILGLLDWHASRQGDDRALEWGRVLKRLLIFGVIATTIGGAVTGAGIWFTIGALSPRATASMLRVFFWPWFIEWLDFIVEVIALLAIYATWDRLQRFRRIRIWLELSYSGYTTISAILITGIIAFMLTPGQWPERPSLLAGFLNPSFVPQLISRLSLSAVAGALISMALVALPGIDDGVRRNVTRVLGVVLLVGVGVLVPSLAWYLLVVPDFYATRKVYAVVTQHLAQKSGLFYVANYAALALAVSIALAGIARRSRMVAWLIVPGLVAMIGFIAEFERIREFIRGPYLMPGHMYVSEVLMQEQFLFDREGALPNNYWYQRLHSTGNLNDAGAQAFNTNCAICHTIGGINDIRQRIAGRPLDSIELLIDRTHEMVNFMPPFAGDRTERRAAARYLYRLGQGTVEMESRSRVVVRKGAPP